MSKTQLMKIKKFMMVYAFFCFCFMGVVLFTMSVNADTTLPSFITAEYTGGSVIVNEPIDQEKLVVTAIYADGGQETVKEYYLPTTVISKEGNNSLTVIYLGKTTTVNVVGKDTVSVAASYFGAPVSIGNAIDPRSIEVYGLFSDGTYEKVTNFQLYGQDITKVGENVVRVIFQGRVTEVKVTGVEPKNVSSLYVTYTGGDVMVGRNIDQQKIYVTATYTDGTSEPIINYLMTSKTPTVIGVNTIMVSYGGKSASFTVSGIDVTVTSITARYVGDSVEVGKSVRNEDIVVTAGYSDGTSQVVTDFTLPSPVIHFIGSHSKTVHYKGYTAEIFVLGVEAKETSYDNAAVFVISNGMQDATCKVALPSGVDTSAITGESIRNTYVARVVTRSVRRSRFISFTIEASETGEEELPLEMVILPPNGFAAEDCGLYYTPNRKTIIGKVNTDVDDEGRLHCILYKTGTYIFAYESEEDETSDNE